VNWYNTIAALEPKCITEDQLNGLKLMLDQDVFKDLHALITEKLKEVQTVEDTVASAFALASGKFYITNNGSIVFSTNGHDGTGDVKTWEMVVIHGGHLDPELETDYAKQIFGNTVMGSVYFADCLGRAAVGLDELQHPMHIIKELPKNKALDIATH
jgi:hypothetical protein